MSVDTNKNILNVFFGKIISTIQKIITFINYDKFTMFLQSYVNDSACSCSFCMVLGIQHIYVFYSIYPSKDCYVKLINLNPNK